MLLISCCRTTVVSGAGPLTPDLPEARIPRRRSEDRGELQRGQRNSRQNETALSHCIPRRFTARQRPICVKRLGSYDMARGVPA